MTSVLPFPVRAPGDAHDPLAIRHAVAATRRLFPEADIGGIADYAIKVAAPTRIIKVILFDQIAAAHALRPCETTFTRAPFAAAIGAARRRT